jgi:hypothetical protein
MQSRPEFRSKAGVSIRDQDIGKPGPTSRNTEPTKFEAAVVAVVVL